jgi:hypothetical protein
MNFDEKVELIELLEERTLSDFERRKRRMRAAEARLWGTDDKGQPRLTGLAELISKARHNTYAYEEGRYDDIQHLTRDEYMVVNGGFLPGEIEAREG